MDSKTAAPVYLDTSSYPFDFAEQYLYTGASPYTVPLQASPQLAFNSLNLSGSPADFVGSYPSNGYSTGSEPPTPGQQQRPFTPVDAIAPHVTTAGIHSGSEDGFTSSRHSHSGRSESPKIPGTASQLVQRREPARRGSNSSTASRLSLQAARRRRARNDDDFDSDDDPEYAPEYTDLSKLPPGKGGKKEEVRRQRIESEQRRRDELREGYRKLKDVLPTSNQKASKVSLLDRATTHIRWLELSNQQLQQRVQAAEMETQRLRHVNEKMMIATAEHNQQALAAAAAQVSLGPY